jgi:hypothetical protein
LNASPLQCLGNLGKVAARRRFRAFCAASLLEFAGNGGLREAIPAASVGSNREARDAKVLRRDG